MSPQRQHCDFTCNGEKICETLDKAGVPADGRWRTLMLYMRGLQEYEFIPEDQKARIQTLVLEALRHKDYSEESYANILRTKQDILNESKQLQIKDALREAKELVTRFGEMVHARKNDVERLGDKTVSLIESQELNASELADQIRFSFREVVETMEKDARELIDLSRTDALTNIANRRWFDEELAEACHAWSTHCIPFSLLFLDIDHFKHFNDAYGHRIGDQAIITVARVLKEYGDEYTREFESPFFPARYGGEEFAVILPGITLDNAMDAATAILERIRTHDFIVRNPDGKVIKQGVRITLSAGVAEPLQDWPGNVPERIIDAADTALYQAKREGRDRVRPFSQGA